MKKKKKGFTLIELLAIIVILAIIAVITVPIILNIIENSKRGAVIDSAYGYKDSINKYYVTELAKNSSFSLNGDYKVNSDGSITSTDDEEKKFPISFSGTKPSGGNITIDDSVVTSACLVIDDYAVELKDGKFTTDGKGNCDGMLGDEPQTITKYNDGTEIYFNVDSGKGCTVEDYKANTDASETGHKAGCMKFFAFLDDTDSDTVNLLLDHNTTATVAWNISGSNSSGPGKSVGEVLYQLQQDTNEWQGTETLDTYDSTSFAETGNQKIDYSSYKARLITAEEIADITGQEGWTSSSFGFYFDSNCVDLGACDGGNNKYWWLFEHTGDGGTEFSCTVYGCKSGQKEDPYGYWTDSPKENKSSTAWYVYLSGALSYSSVDNDSQWGIRPVITVSKSKLSS